MQNFIMHYFADWLGPTLDFAGLLAARLAHKSSSRKAYSIVALYFLLAFLASTLGGPLYGLYYEATQTPEIQERVRMAMELEDQREQSYHEAIDGSGYIPYGSTRTIVLPLGYCVLIVGVWMLALEEKRLMLARRNAGFMSPETGPH